VTGTRIVYLDYAATTPVDPAVAHAMAMSLGVDGDFGDFGNPASATHAFGVRAAMHVERARAQVATLIGADPDEIVFASGATESINLAILGVARANTARGRHIVTSRIEHKAVLDSCKRLEKEGFTVTYLTPDLHGYLDPRQVREALRADTVLVSLMHTNNEIGVMLDLTAVADVCQQRGVLFHTDAAQSAGKVALDVHAAGVDLLSFTAHKMYGPKGVGALYVQRSRRGYVEPVTFGGGHERGLRSGTLATHQLVGFGAACEMAGRVREQDSERISRLRDRLWAGIEALGGVHLNGVRETGLGAGGRPQPQSIAGILNVSFEGVEGESLVTALPRLAVSTGSACNSASGDPSYVLRAVGRDTQLAQSSLRFSLGRFTTEEDIDEAIAATRQAVLRLRAVSPVVVAGSNRGPATGQTNADDAGDDLAVDGPSDAPGLGSLSPLARRYFLELPLGGALPPGTLPRAAGASQSGSAPGAQGPTVVSGEAGGPGTEAWVRFDLLVADGIVKDARFKSYGCPHTLGVASWLTGQLAGRRRDDLVPGSPAGWAEALAVPAEKLGRLLTVEDALRACAREWP
jgi:cysteine desulfurase